MSIGVLVGSIAAGILALGTYIWTNRFPRTPGKSYVQWNTVSHARFFPAAHAFTYPTISLLLSLDALESNALDLARGWVFGYGGVFGRLCGLRAAPYLVHGPRTIKEKLIRLLDERGHEGTLLDDAWISTMPAFCGIEGINPLTVYYCYKSDGELWKVVLEIHNTFGERHVHVLTIGVDEDTEADKGFTNQWTFLREFHVSPFNDRSGYYTISITPPSHGPNVPATTPPYPIVRVHLHTAIPDSTTPGPLKLTAMLRPTHSAPMTATMLLSAVAGAPFGLLMSFPRIVYQAWILHYRKRLDVFIRPEPKPGRAEWVGGLKPAGGIKWLDEGLLEKFARRKIEAFVKRRVEETGVEVSFVYGDPSVPPTTFSPSSGKREKTLSVYYLAPRVFTLLFLSPSPDHALLLANTTEQIMFPSSRELFLTVFAFPAKASLLSSLSRGQELRTRALPESLDLPIPSTHPFEHISLLRVLLALDRFEEWVFGLAGARTVSGDEPWKKWERAAAAYRDGGAVVKEAGMGSVLRAL